jgi:uncharacterized membrane protein (Fun14 family)
LIVLSELFPSLGYQVGTGAVGGFIVGYAVKKMSKLIAVVIGLFLIALIYLGTQGIVSINYEALWKALENALGMAESAFSWVVGIISLLPFAGSFIAAFLLGFKMG